MPSDNARRYDMARLYTFPDDVRIDYRFMNIKIIRLFKAIPDHLLKNVCDQIQGSRVIPKRLDDLKPEDIKTFPQMFKWFVKNSYSKFMNLFFFLGPKN